MVQYSNLFSFSVNERQDEYILYFKQQTPVFDSTGKLSGRNEETVAEIVMNHSGASALKDLLNNMVPSD